MNIYPLIGHHVWTYITRELTKYAKIFMLCECYSYSHAKSTTVASNSSTTVYTYNLPLADPDYGLFIPKTTLNLTKLYALVNYYLVCTDPGLARLKLKLGENEIVVDQLSNSASDKRGSKLINLTNILADDLLYALADVAGDGTDPSQVFLRHTIIIGVSE